MVDRNVVTAIAALTISAALFVWPDSSAQAEELPQSTRKVVYEKVDKAYRLKLTEGALPKLGEHQVLVRVRAVALNRGDWEVLSMDLGVDLSGRIAGTDGAGDVVAVGTAVKDFRPGMKVTSLYFRNWTDGPPDAKKLSGVTGMEVDGVMGDYVVLDDTGVVEMPKGLSYVQAATLPTTALTAWSALTTGRKVGSGDVVVVQGTGGVSAAAIQLGAAMGTRVIVTSSSDEKIAQARKLGAQDGINYKTTPEWSVKVRELTAGRGADLVIDLGGKSTLEQSARSLGYGGGIAIVGGLTGYDGTVPARHLLMKVASAYGVFVGSRADYGRMRDFIEQKKLQPAVDRVYPLAQFEAALEQLKSGNFVGKIVLEL